MSLEPMKVLIINGSHVNKEYSIGYKKGNSFTQYSINKLNNELKKIDPFTQVDQINLIDYNILLCRSCGLCITPGISCPLEDKESDQVKEVIHRMEKSDVIIFASPVYCMNITGKMKEFIDRLSRYFFQPNLIGKIGFSIVTSGGIGWQNTSEYLKHVICTLGMKYVDCLHVELLQINTPNVTAMANKIYDFYFDKTPFFPEDSHIQLFNTIKNQIVGRKKNMEFTFQYWEEKRLLENDYYF